MLLFIAVAIGGAMGSCLRYFCLSLFSVIAGMSLLELFIRGEPDDAAVRLRIVAD